MVGKDTAFIGQPLKKRAKAIYYGLHNYHSILADTQRNRTQLQKKEGGMKIHTLIASDEYIPQLAIMTSAATLDHIMLKRLN